MGQKQSYSLNDAPHNKNAVEDEVAHTFNATEPTPVSLKPMKSLRSPQVKDNDVIADICSEDPTSILSSTGVNTTPLTVISTPIAIPEIPEIPVDTLTVDPELPHSIFVLEQQHSEPEKSEQELIEETICRLDRILIRQQELDELAYKSEPLTIVSDSDSIGNEKLECQTDELVSEGIVLEEDDQELEGSQKFSPASSIPVPYLPGDPYQTSIYEEHLLYRLPELA